MRTALTWLVFRWPREVMPEQAMQLTRLLASAGGTPLVIEAVGSAGLVEHRLALPTGHAESVIDQLRSALPGVAIESVSERPAVHAKRMVELRLTTRLRPLGEDIASSSRALLIALAQTHKHEYLTLQWVLARRLPSSSVPSQVKGLSRESWWGALLLAPVSPPPPLDGERRGQLVVKYGAPGWRAIGRIGVATRGVPRQKQLIGQVLGALRMSDAPGVHWWATTRSPKRLADASRGWRRPLQLNAKELTAVSSFPVGLTSELPIKRLASRLLPPSAAIPRSGLVIGKATFPGRERPLAISADDARRHLAVLGPTGVGKSTLLCHLAAAQIASGGAIVVIEPRGDLIMDILAQVPTKRIDDVVVLDPTDRGRLVGLNPLASSGRSPELVADQLLGLFHSLYAENWGIRTQDILGAALLTLARTRDMTLASLVPLLTDNSVRRRIVGRLPNDPLGLSSFWRTFESWSEGQKLNATAPVMSKLRPILLRPDIRAILGQAHPRFELRQVFTQKKILLVNLAAGQVGPEASALLGSLVIGQLWQAIQERSAIPRERRHPVMVVLDEFQSYTHLPVDLGEALVQARGLGAPFVLAWQFLHQLNPSMRSAVLNLQSKIAFRLEHEDARVMAAGTPLTPDDFQGLEAYEAYAQLVAEHTVQPWCSLVTLPPPEPVSEVEVVRQASRQDYGIDRQEIEAELSEPPRGSWRHYVLRGWADAKNSQEVSGGGSRARGSVGSRASR